MRIHSALFCLAIPFIAVILAKPPRRSEGALGIAVALLLTVVQLKSSAWLEDHFAGRILIAESLHLLAWAGLIAALYHFERVHGEGLIDAAERQVRRFYRQVTVKA